VALDNGFVSEWKTVEISQDTEDRRQKSEDRIH
jgi:hypothetical protein